MALKEGSILLSLKIVIILLLCKVVESKSLLPCLKRNVSIVLYTAAAETFPTHR